MIKNKRKIPAILCGIAGVVCSIYAIPFVKNSPIASADTVTANPSFEDIPNYSSLGDNMLYNPFSPFTLFVSSYDLFPTNDDGALNPLYGFDFPISWGTDTFNNSWITSVTTSGYVIYADYDNTNAMFALGTEGLNSGNAQTYTYSLEAYSTAIWLTPLDYVTMLCDTALEVDLTAQIYNPSTGDYVLVQRSGRDYNPSWVYDDDYYVANLGSYFRYIFNSLDFNPIVDNTDCFVVQSLQMRCYATSDTGELILDGNNHQDYTLMNYYVRSKNAMFMPVPYEVAPDNLFTWIFDAVSSFLAVDILPNFSFGDLVLLALGVMIFGVGLKIAFGG